MPRIMFVNNDTGEAWSFADIDNDHWQYLKSQGEPLEYLRKIIIENMEKNKMIMIKFKLVLEDEYF
ncbi:unnamed protein product [marine sediment metagenome]|uniref:Uncharacterized protein n=1 Tax=marine sediment metagenome TaxID=412755 RepID=X1D0K5_9ZZZZ